MSRTPNPTPISDVEPTPVPISIVDRGDRRCLDGPGFSLSFERVDGRWRHSLHATDGDRVLVSSYEWDADRDDPARVASPVFQELQFHVDRDGVHQALLLGMSGRHHFSAAFALIASEAGVELRVSAADRCRGEVLAVGSTLEILLEPGNLVSADEARITWSDGTHRLNLIAGDSTRLSLAEGGPRATQAQTLSTSGVSVPTRVWNYTLDARRVADQTAR